MLTKSDQKFIDTLRARMKSPVMEIIRTRRGVMLATTSERARLIRICDRLKVDSFSALLDQK